MTSTIDPTINPTTSPTSTQTTTKEAQIEAALIEKLGELKYHHRPDICDRASLEQNFREKFDALNRVTLSDKEFENLKTRIIQPDVFKAAQTLRQINSFEREDGTPLHYTLVNLKDWCKNHFEVINQLRINTENSHQRYDVIILMNGVPVVQIELKALNIPPRKAMEQIVHYKNDVGNGYTNSLLCFMQLFIVSNQNHTRYFANNNNQHFGFNAEEHFLPVYQLASENNEKIHHLHDFAEQFLAKCTLGQMISRYMVLVACEKKLMIMRPYQIYAVKAIVDCIHQNRGNGYIWHTTGSGKTLTSFKAATLLKDNPDVEKCLFVVDRKDLDRQTREEFNKFQEGCVEENTNTETLVQRLLSRDYANKVIVTTIQKLGIALDDTRKSNQSQLKRGKATYKARLEPLRNQRIVFIFDECHRSQFGESHQAIKNFFPKAQLFGFTGTPIFKENAHYKQIDGQEKTLQTTDDIFQKALHCYTITHAIEDKNVLKFHIDYFGEKPKHLTTGQAQPSAPNPQTVAEAILDKHHKATGERRFNALFATASINSAIEYYNLFKASQAARAAHHPDYVPLNIACVFSPPAEGQSDVKQIQEDLPQEKADNQQDPEAKKAALTQIINDYNAQYRTNCHINEFDSYYKDVQQRIKDHKFSNADYPKSNKIDLVIVVDMLLTGFDAKHLNTLYVDKNLRYHGLIQAFSRTNRVLNSSKPQGNILDFRHQKVAVDKAIELFSGKSGTDAEEIWQVAPAYDVVQQLDDAVAQLQTFMQSQNLDYSPSEVNNLKGDAARVQFLKHFKEIQRLNNTLSQYTDLSEAQQETIQQLLPKDQLNGFKGMYLTLAQQIKAEKNNTTDPSGNSSGDPTDDPTQQLELELVLFSSVVIDYDYIMNLAANTTGKTRTTILKDREELIEIIRASANFADERDELTAYIHSLPLETPLTTGDIQQGYQQFKAQKAAAVLVTLAEKNHLSPEALQGFAEQVIEDLYFDGDRLSDLFAPLDLGWKARIAKEQALLKDLIPYLKQQAQERTISGLAAYES